MKLKKIGISLRVEKIEKFNEKRDTISHDWINFLQKLDYFPVLIPNNLTDVEDYISELKLNGIILSGGDNIGEFPERDQTENKILEYAIKNSIPVLGVCRGMQLINTFFNGTISENSNSGHVGKPHNIDIMNPSLVNLFGHDKLEVNSFHNNLIKKDDIGDELDVFALSEKDFTIEGCFHKKYPIIGVMWHPERDQQKKHQSQIIDIFCNKKIW
jgi:putative glutamine amidotransferase